MTIEYLDCEQNSTEWFAARLGLVTASNFAAVLAKGEGKTRRAYLLRLAGERLTGVPAETYENGHMIRGRDMEAEARDVYAFAHDVALTRVGFIRKGDVGCSPDSLVANEGILEVKTKLPHILIECLLKDEMPPEHRAQVQGSLWVAERDWCDFAAYWPTLPLFLRRQGRDEPYIKTLAGEVERFNEELNHIVESLRHYGWPPHERLRMQLKASVG